MVLPCYSLHRDQIWDSLGQEEFLGSGAEGFARLRAEKTFLSSHAVFLVLITDRFCGRLFSNSMEASALLAVVLYSPGDRFPLPLLFFRLVFPFRDKKYF